MKPADKQGPATPGSAPVFRQLLDAAAAEPQPQRLLFVFVGTELPAGASAEQAARHGAGQGGTLTPRACVDKGLDELGSFESLVEESRQACPPWGMVFIAALSGQAGRPPAAQAVDAALRRMVENIQAGRLAGYLVLDERGEPLRFT